jgi:PD-(D/E)XK endonuclease
MKKKCGVKKETAICSAENVVAHGRHSKRKGELSELEFMCKVVSMGFGVSMPYGDSERFDFIVTSGQLVWRVQVKSTYKAYKDAYGVRACGNEKHGLEAYTPQEIDVIVVYIVPENAWYVIPIGAIRKRRWLYFHPNGTVRGVYQYEQYREAWHLLREPDGGAQKPGTARPDWRGRATNQRQQRRTGVSAPHGRVR